MAPIFAVLGALILLIGAIWFIIETFRESIIWGLLCFFFPIVGLVFFFVHLDKAWKPVAVQCLGLILMAVGFFALGDALGELSRQ